MTHKLSLSVPQSQVAPIEAALEAIFDDGTGARMPGIAAFENADDTSIWTVEAYFQFQPAADDLARAKTLAEQTAGPVPDFTIQTLPDEDWVSLSQSMLKPVQAGRFFIHGSHDRDRRVPDAINLEIEAGQAFGTGQHETTHGCLLALDALAEAFQPTKAADIGTGSGVLAFAITKLWPITVIASDMDAVSVTVLQENAAVNGIAIDGSAGAIRPLVATDVQHDLIQADAPFDLVCANILAAPLIEMAPRLAAAVSQQGVLILSGLLKTQEDEVSAAYEAQGMAVANRYPLGDWQTLVMRP